MTPKIISATTQKTICAVASILFVRFIGITHSTANCGLHCPVCHFVDCRRPRQLENPILGAQGTVFMVELDDQGGS
jgi:hypothetical protein